MKLKKIAINTTSKKDNGVWTLDTQRVLPEEDFCVVEQSIVWLPPRQTAANHKHSRREALIGLGSDCFFVWKDSDGQIHEEEMNPDGQLYIFVIPSQVPHTVVNKNPHTAAVLYEYFDDIYRGVEAVQITKALC